MENHLSRYVCTLWVSAMILIAARYISGAILAAGSFGDAGILKNSMDALGPFLPIMSIVCLAGGLALSVADLIASKRRK